MTDRPATTNAVSTPVAVAAVSPLAFSLENAQHQPVIYITTDPSLNTLSFTLLNNSGEDLVLRGGAPVAESKQQAGGLTCLYLSMQGLASNAEFSASVIEADGWQSTWFADENQWGLAPSSDMTLASQAVVTFSIAKLVAGEHPRSGFLNVDYWNLGSLAAGNHQLKVFLQNPPDPKLQPLALTHGFLGSNVVFTGGDRDNARHNSLTFMLGNPSPTSPVVPPETPVGDDPAVFILSFVYGKSPGYGALTTPKEASQITVALDDANGNRWKVHKAAQVADPTWILSPLDHEVLGTGQSANVSFAIDEIVTYLQPGLTTMYLQYANVPGYNEGHYAFTIQKQEPVRIDSLTTDPVWRTEQAGAAPVTVKWATSNALSLELRGDFGAIDVTGETSWTSPAPVKGSRRYTLHANGAHASIADANVDFDVLKFSASGDLASSFVSAGFQEAAYSKKWDRAYFVNPLGRFLSFDTRSNNPLASATLPMQYASDMAASPSISADHDRLYIADGNANALLVIDVDIHGNPTVTRTVPLGQYMGGAVAVTPDGQTLYVNGGEWGISYLNIHEWKLHHMADVPPSLDVRGIVVAPDGRTVYVASGGHTVVGYDTTTQAITGRAAIETFDVAVSSDSRRVYSATEHGVTVIYPHEEWRTELIAVEGSSRVFLSPADQLFFVAGWQLDSVVVVDSSTDKVARTLPVVHSGQDHPSVSDAAFSPDGRRLYLSSNGFGFGVVEVKIDVVGVTASHRGSG